MRLPVMSRPPCLPVSPKESEHVSPRAVSVYLPSFLSPIIDYLRMACCSGLSNMQAVAWVESFSTETPRGPITITYASVHPDVETGSVSFVSATLIETRETSDVELLSLSTSFAASAGLSTDDLDSFLTPSASVFVPDPKPSIGIDISPAIDSIPDSNQSTTSSFVITSPTSSLQNVRSFSSESAAQFVPAPTLASTSVPLNPSTATKTDQSTLPPSTSENAPSTIPSTSVSESEDSSTQSSQPSTISTSFVTSSSSTTVSISITTSIIFPPETSPSATTTDIPTPSEISSDSESMTSSSLSSVASSSSSSTSNDLTTSSIASSSGIFTSVSSASTSLPSSTTSFSTSNNLTTSSIAFSSDIFTSISSASTSLPPFTTTPGRTTTLSLPSSDSRPTNTIELSTSTYFTTVFHSSHDSMTTISSVVESGVLSTNTPGDRNGFSRNTGAIIGVAFASTASLIIAVFVIFFACKRYKGRRAPTGSRANVPHTSLWHSPLAGDDESQHYAGQHGGLLADTLPSSTDLTQVENNGATTNSAGHGMYHGLNGTEASPPTIRPTFTGPQPFPSLGQSVPAITELTSRGPMLLGVPPNTTQIPHEPSNVWPLAHHSPADAYAALRTTTPTGLIFTDGNHSAASLNAGSSSHGHNAGSSSHGHPAASTSSGHGLLDKGCRPFDETAVPTVQKISPTSFKGFMGRLRPMRAPEIVVQGTGSRSSHESVYSETIPRGTKHDRPSLNVIQPGSLWPPATLPPLPSPLPDNSPMLEGLLTPHLGTRMTSSEHSSSASLRDNVDYSRPISGLVRNRLHSTMTFMTDNTVDAEVMSNTLIA